MTKLRQIRQRLRLTAAQLAAALGIKPRTVQLQEQRGIRKKSTAVRYAAALGCRWHDLID